MNMFPPMCGSKGRCLVINLSYHTCISFTFSPFPYNIMYLSWLATSYGFPSFMMLVWSYHRQFKYVFTSTPLGKWAYSSPWYTSRYYCKYCFRKWNTCLEGGFPLFPSPHSTTNGYPYHQRWFSDLDGHHHCWPN